MKQLNIFPCFLVIFFALTNSLKSNDFLNEPLIVSHQIPTKHDSLLNQLSSQRGTNDHSQHDHSSVETLDDILKDMDAHNHNILSKNHGLIDAHAKKLGKNPHEKTFHYNPNANPDINSELASKINYKVQSHDIEAMKQQHKSSLGGSERLFGTYDWKHLPDAKKQEEIRNYNSELQKKNEKKLETEHDQYSWHLGLPMEAILRRMLRKTYYTFNERGKLANALTGEEVNEYSNKNIVYDDKNLIREEEKEKFIENEYLPNGVKSIDNEEIEDIEYDKAMENEKKNRKYRKKHKFWYNLGKLLNKSVRVGGIRIYYIFYSILIIATLSIFWIFIIFWILYRNKKRAISQQKRYFGEIGINNVNKYAIDDNTDDVHITIHREKFQEPYYDPSSPSRDVIV